MRKRIRAFFSGHAWKISFTFKKFLIHWISIFSIIWTFIEFTSYFVSKENNVLKPSIWIVIIVGVLIACWMSRPRLTRTVKIKDKDITIRIVVDDLFRMKGATAIIPANSLFRHDHVSEASVQVQYRNQYFLNSYDFDSQLNQKLINESYTLITFDQQQVKEYPIGTVIRLETPTKKMKAAYLVATAELNIHGIANPSRDQLREGLKSLWKYIALRGQREPLMIPIIGSGRHRINVNRFELIHDIIKSFLLEIKDSKFTEELTIVIHPDAFLRNQYSLDELEEYLRYVSKFEGV